MNYDINLNDLRDYNIHHTPLNIKNAALIIIEMQNVFKGEIISEKQVDNVKKLIEFSKSHNMINIYVQHNDSSEKSENMIQWWDGDKIIKGSYEWEIIEGFDTKDAVIIDKSQYSAFYETELDIILNKNNITDLIICGVMTNCCCETTTRDAFMRGYNVFFINDATGTINADLHLSALKNISFGFASVVNTNDFIKS